ncbi:13590_t:CDS:1, partial [Gigaspora rosea]
GRLKVCCQVIVCFGEVVDGVGEEVVVRCRLLEKGRLLGKGRLPGKGCRRCVIVKKVMERNSCREEVVG